MKPMRPLLPALAFAVCVAGHALAQAVPPSAEQAKVLEKQVREALASMTDGTVKIADRPVEFTPEGDHYLVRAGLGQLGKIEPADAAFTAHARMLDATRWILEDQQFPAQFKVTATVAVPDAPDAKNPSPDGTHPETLTYDVKLGQQDATGTFDPTYATPTTSQGTITTLDVLRTGGVAPSLTHFGRFTTQTSLTPTDPAHIDLLSDATGQDYANETGLPDGTTFKMTAKTVRIVSSLTGLAHAKLLPLLHEAIEASKLKPAFGDDDPKAKQAVNAALQRMLTGSMALLSGGKIDETATGIKFDFGGHAGAMEKVDFAFGGEAPQDMLSATLNFSMDGLVLDDLPPAFAAYVPAHFGIRPTLSNVSAADLTKIASDAAAAPDGRVPPADFEALFKHGGINFGFDALGLDIAGTQFAGSGTFTMAGPQAVSGQAEVSAHGLDALITKAQADPLLQRGVPVIIFLKGIAHVTGDQAVWQVAVANQKVLVNGVDLGAMAGAMR